MSNSRFRLRHIFWLDVNKPDEAELAETISYLKEQRSFAATIRDGIRLVCDLRAGRLDVLLELFPWMAKELSASHPSDSSTSKLERQLERLEQMMLYQGSSSTKPAPPGSPKPLGVTQHFSGPIHDDDGDHSLNIRKDTSTDAAQNFINSMMSLQH